jgi:O-antigen/teichoic acid export membrane protein
MKFLTSKISQNTFWLFSGQSLVKIVAFLYAIFLARALGPTDFGFYIYVITIFGLVSSLSDLGFNRFLVRAIARDKSQLFKYLSNVFTLRFFLIIVIFLIVSLILLIFDPKISRSSLAILALISILPQAAALTFDAIFVALEKMFYSALALVSLNLFVAFLGFLAVFVFKLGIFGAVLSFLFAHILYLLTFGTFLLKEKISFSFSFNLLFWKEAIFASLPYGLLAFLGLLYFKIDAVLLTFIKSETQTGFYGASYKFLEGLHFIPLTIGTVLFPVMARLHQDNLAQLRRLYFLSLKFLLPVAIFLTLILFFGAPVLIKILYGPDFAPSILALQILSFTLLFMFLHVPGAHLILASEKFLKPALVLSIFTVLFNIVLNLILIPPFGLIGASAVTVFSEAISFSLFFWFIQKKIFIKV